MNVLLISQCSKRALTETRRILDQFAERKGERTWQTAITLAGLETLRKLLRKTARKNTAVACHWIRGKDDSELLWLVGDASQFNPEGSVPTNTTGRNVLRSGDENDWHSLTLIRQLVAMAALLHDLGKANQAFQDRLRADVPSEKNRYRHEWVSVRLFQAFVGNDEDATWLQRLAQGADESVDALAFEALWLDYPAGRLVRDGLDQAAAFSKPLSQQEGGLPPLARVLAWLVLAHHRLPAIPRSVTEAAPPALWHGRRIKTANGTELLGMMNRIGPDWNEPWAGERVLDALVGPYWTFRHGLPVRTLAWRKRAARIAQGLLRSLAMPPDCLQDSYVMHVARMSLMLGDHHYSSLKQMTQRVQGEVDYPLFANTDRVTGALLQPLDEHLLGVERDASRLVHALPALTRELPRLANHRGLRKRSADARFRWQDRASDKAAAVRFRAAEHGAFVVNMASTGYGKTLGNVRIMNSLADPALGLRCAFAIGLRTLTLQTGRSFQRDLGLGDDELAIQVGGEANRELFDYYEQLAEQGGSASRMALLDESSHVLYEGGDDHPALQFLGTDAGTRKLLAAPMLVCTIDHLMPATEGLRGGRQIAPMLRLLTGDLVLDEPDDFDLTDLPALTRLVHWAGLLGAKLLLSSATLPPALVSGLFMAYLDGRRSFQRNRGQRPEESPAVCCLWVDEFSQSQADCMTAESFQQHHQAFTDERTRRLSMQAVRRRAALLKLPTELSQLSRAERRELYAKSLRDAALQLHAGHHSVDPRSGKRISFGLIRMANIDPLIDVALSLFKLGAPEGVHIHLCVYHSQFPLFLRSAIEYRLDTALNRRDDQAVFDLRDIRDLIDSRAAQDQLFVVLGSPVTEVGRDHDYDWAVVEPSSMRSLIQLAGRVLRHRQAHDVEQPNLLVSNTNLRHIERPGEPAFCRPGFESPDFPLQSHELGVLLGRWLDADGCMAIDARPRISPRLEAELQPARDLVDLEHARLVRQMLPSAAAEVPVRRNRLAAREPVASSGSTALNASSFWRWECVSLTGGAQQLQPFREETRPMEELVWLPDEDEENCSLYWIPKEMGKWQQTYVPVERSLNHCIPDDAVRGAGISPWGGSDIMSAMAAQAQAMDLPLAEFAQKFAGARLPKNMQGWRWHPVLGFGLRD